ncbi:hypothetical protein R4172_11050 [Rhodococcus kroppenstedtii]|uniref:hypothetical protein n=1 Tax=Rhodococcoides kroppenstedtii TaxID=293050 RepID=UPI002955826F|nr:hypothetical protein [Rhodococcus kroppenstedtii]MDV7198101.1 hypothetical protein [Rhodococcus kroppenstedtii]
MSDEVDRERRRRARLTGHNGYPSTPLRDWPRRTDADEVRRASARVAMSAMLGAYLVEAEGDTECHDVIGTECRRDRSA